MRNAGNRWVFPELLTDGLQPHSTRWLLTNGLENATHGVDVSGEPLERGIASLEAHAEYLAAIPGHPAPRTMISGFTRMQGRAMGVPNVGLSGPPSDPGGTPGGRSRAIQGGIDIRD